MRENQAIISRLNLGNIAMSNKPEDTASDISLDVIDDLSLTTALLYVLSSTHPTFSPYFILGNFLFIFQDETLHNLSRALKKYP
jgi:hypothetical protein